MIKSIIQLLRPHQWLKNLFIFLPLFFDRQLTDLDKLLAVVGAFVAVQSCRQCDLLFQ